MLRHPDSCGRGGKGSPERPTHMKNGEGAVCTHLHHFYPSLPVERNKENKGYSSNQEASFQNIPDSQLKAGGWGEPVAAPLKHSPQNSPISKGKVCELLVSPQSHLLAESRFPDGLGCRSTKTPSLLVFLTASCLPLQSQGQPGSPQDAPLHQIYHQRPDLPSLIQSLPIAPHFLRYLV